MSCEPATTDALASSEAGVDVVVTVGTELVARILGMLDEGEILLLLKLTPAINKGLVGTIRVDPNHKVEFTWLDISEATSCMRAVTLDTGQSNIVATLYCKK